MPITDIILTFFYQAVKSTTGYYIRTIGGDKFMIGPERLTIVRHAVSTYNNSKEIREKDPEYQEFKKAYDTDWLSSETRRLAESLRPKLVIPGGEAETPIEDAFAYQARRTGSYLEEIGITPHIVITSPYLRARQTLSQMRQEHFGLSWIDESVDPRIRERDHGIMPEYGDRKIFFVFNPEERAKFEKGEYEYRYPGGENIVDVKVRVESWLKDICRKYRGSEVMAVTHHETILVMRMILEGLTREDYLRIDKKDKPINCGVTQYQHDRHRVGFGTGLELEFYNEDMFSNEPPYLD